MSQKVIINPARTLFYCWSWDRWKSLKRLRYCFEQRCQRMYEPEGEHLRKAGVRG
ncbi:MAG: hypothetical protein M1438_04855 [Deltaproteobacteria bacterium]|nr:hypothetical protein [Deltaproteobacteria bacterium]